MVDGLGLILVHARLQAAWLRCQELASRRIVRTRPGREEARLGVERHAVETHQRPGDRRRRERSAKAVLREQGQRAFLVRDAEHALEGVYVHVALRRASHRQRVRGAFQRVDQMPFTAGAIHDADRTIAVGQVAVNGGRRAHRP